MRNLTTVSHALVMVMPQPITVRPVIKIMDTVNANWKLTKSGLPASWLNQRTHVFA